MRHIITTLVELLKQAHKNDCQTKQTSKMKGIKEFMDRGALLGHLWMEGYFEAGDPLTASGA